MAKAKKKTSAKPKAAAKKAVAKKTAVKAAPAKKAPTQKVTVSKPAVVPSSAKATKKKNLTLLWLLVALTALLYFIAIVRLGQGY